MKTLKDYFELKANGLGIEGSSLKNDRTNEDVSPTPSNVRPKFTKQLKMPSKTKKSVVKLSAETTMPISKYFSKILAPSKSSAVKSSRTGLDKLVGEDKSLGRTGSLD